MKETAIKDKRQEIILAKGQHFQKEGAGNNVKYRDI